MGEANAQRKDKMKRPRLAWLDVWRGLAVLNMCLYHGIWDLVYYFRLPGFDWYSAVPGYIWQQCICWSFIFLSGYSYALGQNKFRRAATILFAGVLVEAVAGAWQQEIHYGILSFLGLWQLLLVLPEDWLARQMRLRSWQQIGRLGFVLSAVLFFLCRNVNQGNLGFESVRLVTLPRELYHSNFTACLGFPPAEFESLDYFSLLPWGFLFLAGYFLSQYQAEQRRDAEAAAKRAECAPAAPVEAITLGDVLVQRIREGHPGKCLGQLFAFLGKRALLIYLLHQPVLMAVFELIGKFRH